ncbi:MAG: nodulation protein NfeD [Chloroflexi bacterium]|nr:nodulation protein NfeD [Chloroflexota bacterium]
MTRHLVRAVNAALVCLGLIGMVAGGMRAAGAGDVVVLPTTGVVDNVMAGYLRDGVARAASEGAPAVVIRLNTPGGSVEATNDIVGTLLEAPIPTIVWVAPSGGRAASAGTFITLASHVALMAPGTSIGAASPVGSGGEEIPGTLGDKVRNDAVAKIRAIAEERGRDVEWAVSTVEEAVASPAAEAVERGAVDGIAGTIEEVLAMAHGREVEVGGANVTLDLQGRAVRELPMNPFQSFLHLLSDGNIAALLFSLGSLGLLYELASPNFVTGILGALAIILAFIGFGSLPLNVGGLLLIGLAMLLFILELTVLSHGLLAIGGLVCFALGLSALYTEPGSPTAPDVTVAFPLVVVMTVTIAAFMALAIVTVMRSRRRGALVGYGAGGSFVVPAGTTGEVRRPLAPVGSVYAVGEEWRARTADDRLLERGTPVRVIREEGLTLIVEPADATGAGA